MHPPRNRFAYQQVALQALPNSVIGLDVSGKQHQCFPKAKSFRLVDFVHLKL
jgi:hypothetical protein